MWITAKWRSDTHDLTYFSWLNQVEIWFTKIERDVISRGVFSSVPDLRRKLMKYITRYNDQPRPFAGDTSTSPDA